MVMMMVVVMMGQWWLLHLSFLHLPTPLPCTPRPASTTDWLGRIGRISVYSIWSGERECEGSRGWRGHSFNKSSKGYLHHGTQHSWSEQSSFQQAYLNLSSMKKSKLVGSTESITKRPCMSLPTCTWHNFWQFPKFAVAWTNCPKIIDCNFAVWEFWFLMWRTVIVMGSQFRPRPRNTRFLNSPVSFFKPSFCNLTS